MTRFKSVMVNVLLILASLLVGLAVFEIGARIAGISYPMLQTHDLRRGFALRPGAAGWWRWEGEAYVQINQDGLRDRDHSRTKPDDTIRIAILGDSYAEARSVALEDTFWAVLERELDQCPAVADKTVEVINFGVTDYGTTQQLLTLRHHVWAYEPDMVLLAFFSGNDVRNNSVALEHKNYRPFVSLVDGKLVLDNGFRDSMPYRLLSSWQGRLLLSMSDYLVSVQVAREVFVGWYKRRKKRANVRAAEARGSQLNPEQGLDTSIYADPADASWQDAWRVTDALIATIAREVSNHGAEFLLVTLSSGQQTNPDPKVRQAYAEALGVPDLWYPERRLKALAESQQFEIFTLAPLLQRYAERERVFLHGFANTEFGRGHWNEDGHRIAGQFISDHICSRWNVRPSNETDKTLERSGHDLTRATERLDPLTLITSRVVSASKVN